MIFIFDSSGLEGRAILSPSGPPMREGFGGGAAAQDSAVLLSPPRRVILPPIVNGAMGMKPGMKPSAALKRHRAAIRRIVAANRAANARVFGSVLHGLDTEQSDLDLLVDPTPKTSLFDLGAIQYELVKLLGVKVDVRTPMDLPKKFRAAVVAEASPV